MSRIIAVAVPDIGDFEDVEVVEILVRPGDRIAAEDSLISIESDKATMEVPSPAAGVVRDIAVSLGDRVSEGSLILHLETQSGAVAVEAPAEAEPPKRAEVAPQTTTAAAGARAKVDAPPAAGVSAAPSAHFDVAVLGGGPGGYTAAFRCADLGKRVVLIERTAELGGVCLSVGCIPSKALLHTAEVINDARELAGRGVDFGEPRFDLPKLREFKSGVVERLSRGLASLAEQRGVTRLQGEGRFVAARRISVSGPAGESLVSFDACIIAAGSRSVELPNLPADDPRVVDSTGALDLPDIPGRLLVIGGGIIGLEIATIYAALGTRLTLVELTAELLPGCDRDLVQPLQRRLKRRSENIFLSTRVTGVAAEPAGLRVHFEGPKAPASDLFDRVLVAVGRRPNADRIDAAAAGVALDAAGFIAVDAEMRTNVPHIFAVGDIAGPPLLAHKAIHEGKTAAEVIAGLPAAFDAAGIPSVAYTDPEIAWVGLTETAAAAQGIAVEVGVFPWSASGRALANGRSDGLTKLLVDPETRLLVGAGIVGRNAGELIAEAVLALEMAADAEDIGLSIHPHPTLSETFGLAAEMVEGTITDLLAARK